MRLLVPLLLVLLPLAGCLDDPEATDASVEAPEPSYGPFATVALVDTGINPYHVDFREEGPLADVHPSKYLPDYPADAETVRLTLDAATLDDALEADQETWDGLEAGKLYWFPGTKIVGAYATSEPSGDRPAIFDTGHGTMVASRAAGNGYSLCPECRIAMVQGFDADSVTWASEQPWIDAQSNSWSPAVVFQQADVAQSPGLADAFEAAAQRHLVFGSAGNGVGGKLGGVGHPAFTRSTSGPPGVVAVGGHDNGDVVLWSGSWPHVVADACQNWAAVGDSIEDYSPSRGGGTSSASPYAAGAAARIVLEARTLLGHDAGVEDGVLARGEATELLEDGVLTLDGLKRILFGTATERPVATEHDGAYCGMEGAPYNTYPVAWSDVPEGTPTYPFIGYGQISVDSVALALEVLRGEAEMPARPEADAWHERAEALRDTYNGLPV